MRSKTSRLDHLVWIALPAWLVLAFSCTENNSYTSFFDPDELACSDGVDNDEDGFVDLADPGCFGNPLWDSEAGEPACSDGIDNDGDTFTDFDADPECSSESDSREDV